MSSPSTRESLTDPRRRPNRPCERGLTHPRFGVKRNVPKALGIGHSRPFAPKPPKVPSNGPAARSPLLNLFALVSKRAAELLHGATPDRGGLHELQTISLQRSARSVSIFFVIASCGWPRVDGRHRRESGGGHGRWDAAAGGFGRQRKPSDSGEWCRCHAGAAGNGGPEMSVQSRHALTADCVFTLSSLGRLRSGSPRPGSAPHPCQRLRRPSPTC